MRVVPDSMRSQQAKSEKCSKKQKRLFRSMNCPKMYGQHKKDPNDTILGF